VLFFLFILKKNLNNLLIAIGLTLILGGAVGNLIDRFFLGYVIDFISIHVNDTFYWPVFNIADSAISIGVLLLIYDTFKKRNTSD
jgi:signal peptidase II